MVGRIFFGKSRLQLLMLKAISGTTEQIERGPAKRRFRKVIVVGSGSLAIYSRATLQHCHFIIHVIPHIPSVIVVEAQIRRANFAHAQFLLL